MKLEDFIDSLSYIGSKIKLHKTTLDTQCALIKGEYDKEALISKELLTVDQYWLYEKRTVLDQSTLEPKVPEENSFVFLGFANKIDMTPNKTKFLSDKKDSIVITMQILNHLNEKVKAKEKIFIKYNGVIYERETDENGHYDFEIKTLQSSRITIQTVNSNMLNSNIIVEAQ